MRVQFLKWWSDLRSSYWFLPAVLAAASVVSAFVMLWVDRRFEWRLPMPFQGLHSSQPAGARSLLATLAGSMITVAGLTFSMTLLAFSHASMQFGPRLLSNFMRNRGNQFVLGVYVSTFLYCLIVLGAVHASEPAAPGGPMAVQAFVPSRSLAVAMLLAVVDVGVLIFYIHHVAESIRLSSIIASVGDQLHRSIETLFPAQIGCSETEVPASADRPQQEIEHALRHQPAVIASRSAGFVQRLDESGLMELAVEHDLIVELLRRPGDFVAKDEPLLRAGPIERITADVRQRLEATYATGVHRTPDQNAIFLADQLAEVAIRALSPGTNDPRTAIDCLNWLSSVLYDCRDRPDPSPRRFDPDGQLRVLAPVVTYESICHIALEQLRPYFATDTNAAHAMMTAIDWLAQQETSPQRRTLLRRHANRLYETAAEGGMQEIELERLRAARPT